MSKVHYGLLVAALVLGGAYVGLRIASDRSAEPTPSVDLAQVDEPQPTPAPEAAPTELAEPEPAPESSLEIPDAITGSAVLVATASADVPAKPTSRRRSKSRSARRSNTRQPKKRATDEGSPPSTADETATPAAKARSERTVDGVTIASEQDEDEPIAPTKVQGPSRVGSTPIAEGFD